MTVKKWLTISLMFLVLLSGCKGNSSDVSSDTKVANDNEYNLLISNNSPLFLKSVVVTVEEEKEKDNNQKNALIDANINHGEVAKFRIGNGKQVFKITLNPQKNYSVSKVFSDKFKKDEVVEYQVKIDQNEVTIEKRIINNSTPVTSIPR